MAIRLDDQDSWKTARLAELRKLSCETIQQLQPECSVWDQECEAAANRGKKHKIDLLLEEFRGQFRDGGEEFHYEHAFKPRWYQEHRKLYDCRWWVNAQTAGVYFIYNESNALEYVGTSCGGTIGARIWMGRHSGYAESVDVVLFDSHWAHFALALEALAISRLRPPRNAEDRGFTRMWIDPLPPYEHLWPRKGDQNDSGAPQ